MKKIRALLVITTLVCCSIDNSYGQDCSNVQIDRFTKEKSSYLNIYRNGDHELLSIKIDTRLKNIFQMHTSYASDFEPLNKWESTIGLKRHEIELDEGSTMYLLFDNSESVELHGDENPPGTFKYRQKVTSVQYTFSNSDQKLLTNLRTRKLTDIRLDYDFRSTIWHVPEDKQSHFINVLMCFEQLN